MFSKKKQNRLYERNKKRLKKRKIVYDDDDSDDIIIFNEKIHRHEDDQWAEYIKYLDYVMTLPPNKKKLCFPYNEILQLLEDPDTPFHISDFYGAEGL